MRNFTEWIREHEVEQRIGLFIGIVSLIASVPLGLKGTAGNLLYFGGTFLVGVAATTNYFLRRQRYQFRAEESTQDYTLSGMHGAVCRSKSRLLLKAMKDLDEFTPWIGATTGSKKNEGIRIRNHGRRPRVAPTAFQSIDQSQINVVEVLPGRGFETHIHPSSPVKRGEILEIIREMTTENAFANHKECVAKRAIFPLRKNHIILRFEGCEAHDFRGTIREYTGAIVKDIPLPISHGNGNFEVEWLVKKLKPGQECSVTWVWDGATTP